MTIDLPKTAVSSEIRVNAAADRGYDADWIRELAIKKGAWANPAEKQS